MIKNPEKKNSFSLLSCVERDFHISSFTAVHLATVNKPSECIFCIREHTGTALSRVSNFVYAKCVLIGWLVVWDNIDVSQIYGNSGTFVYPWRLLKSGITLCPRNSKTYGEDS